MNSTDQTIKRLISSHKSHVMSFESKVISRIRDDMKGVIIFYYSVSDKMQNKVPARMIISWSRIKIIEKIRFTIFRLREEVIGSF